MATKAPSRWSKLGPAATRFATPSRTNLRCARLGDDGCVDFSRTHGSGGDLDVAVEHHGRLCLALDDASCKAAHAAVASERRWSCRPATRVAAAGLPRRGASARTRSTLHWSPDRPATATSRDRCWIAAVGSHHIIEVADLQASGLEPARHLGGIDRAREINLGARRQVLFEQALAAQHQRRPGAAEVRRVAHLQPDGLPGQAEVRRLDRPDVRRSREQRRRHDSKSNLSHSQPSWRMPRRLDRDQTVVQQAIPGQPGMACPFSSTAVEVIQPRVVARHAAYAELSSSSACPATSSARCTTGRRHPKTSLSSHRTACRHMPRWRRSNSTNWPTATRCCRERHRSSWPSCPASSAHRRCRPSEPLQLRLRSSLRAC